MAKSRIAHLDKIKGISILLVVFCHSVMLSPSGVLGNIVMCIAWGAVPCFFMVTGALLNNAEKFDWKKYFIRFFKAYVVLAVWKIIYLLAACSYSKVDISLSKLFEYVFLFGNLDGVKTGAMWFMTAYLLVLLFYPLTWHLMHGGKSAKAALLLAGAFALFGGILLNSLNLCSELLTDLFGRKFPDFSNAESVLPLGNYKNMLFYFIAGGFVMNKKDKIESFFSERALGEFILQPCLLSARWACCLSKNIMTAHLNGQAFMLKTATVGSQPRSWHSEFISARHII